MQLKPILALLFASFITVSAYSQERLKGNGTMKKEKRTVSGSFDEIAASGKYKVFIKQGATHSVEIEADENLLPYLETTVSGETLELHSKHGYSLQPTDFVTVWVTLTELEELSASGSCVLNTEGTVRGKSLEISISGKGDGKLDLAYDKLEVNVSGSGKLSMNGKAAKAEIAISGSGDIDAPGLQSSDMELAISGSGNASVNVSKKLEVAISGSGTVKYKGNPSIDQSVSGKGRVIHEN